MIVMNSSSKLPIIWMWKLNANPWTNVGPDTWEQYSDIENYIIENAHQQNKNQVELDHFWFDFNKQIQINKQDLNKQRAIMREIMYMLDKDIREHRFTMQQPKLDYKPLNMSDPFLMREADICKGMFTNEKDREYGQTLGPYCALSEKYLRDSPNQEEIIVYQCATLTNEMIHEYKENIGRLAWWDAFSSTIKNEHKALQFGGNTLFVIYIPRQKHCLGVEISSLSVYLDKEEILLQPALNISIQRIQYEPKINKHQINLEVSSCSCTVEKIESGHKSYYS
ncbi:unnamed protein product [Rotaria sp. Silwood2]|nr:unnamed protein product [Rotaria sp. Silwood2]CAF3071590.1 unnamed protein product [Rotaria sp. Silwood2]CAF3099496.1 unnamed protein product [Rotaria sp. Silwood2]CAF3243223.1 unnamed protein product [Rotaria sp. Silwood2]CAF4088587.1 unnamed protein product [Rotaria sp. Silwood2]